MKTLIATVIILCGLFAARYGAFAQAWTQSSAPQDFWTSVASSADGTKLLVGVIEGPIYTSTNSGMNWTSNKVPNALWFSVASSASGMNLAAVAGDGLIYTSTNAGATWTSNDVPPISWTSVASSADGSKLVVLASSGSVYTSTDSGTTRVSNSIPVNTQQTFFVSSSADGTKLVLIPGGWYGGQYGTYETGLIFTSYSTPTPQLNLTSSNNNLAFSWIVPSTNFVLQQNLDLTTTNWVTLTNVPTLNFTNLQDEVTLSPTNSSSFFRLIAQ